jgi:hypothetical protein
VKVHLVADRRLAEVGETTHGLEVGGARRSQREQALVLDQKAVVLADPEAKPLEVERPVADPAHERMVMLHPPDRVSGPAQLLADAHLRPSVRASQKRRS